MESQLFPIIYQNERIMVDPSSLYNSSRKFQELISEINFNDIHTKHLRVAYDKITTRNLSNFLKICQNKQADVQDSEMKEICLIAKLFQADQIYKTGLTFVQCNIDSNFFIPEDQFEELNGQKYLLLEEKMPSHQEKVTTHQEKVTTYQEKVTAHQEQMPIHHLNFNELEFEDENECISKDINKNENVVTKKIHSVCYQITEDIPLIKRARFYFSKHNEILYMAKMKKNTIYIGKGTDLHISENKIQDSGKIIRTDDAVNIVETDDQQFKIKFMKFGDSYSITTMFVNNGQQQTWKPKEIKSLAELGGEHNHKPMQSKRNIILQNLKNKPTLIIRKMTNKYVEAECHPDVNPIIIFAISLSQIIGPSSL